AVGDYVVHENHGLGIYQGIEKIRVGKVEKDYIKIAYAKGSNLYILASQFDLIGKYGNVGDKKPKLSTLGTTEWTKTKSKVRGAVAAVAKDLVSLYAARQQTKGYAYGKDTVWQQEFEETFPYEETAGQLSAIEDVKADMMSEKIMDRLICGDVGYGKTEVAIRAAFKAVQEGKQVVYLCPTTILCSQHYNTFVQRMAAYPINIGMLSRFRTTAQNKETIAKLKSGEMDIVIGTHRALSKDVGYKDLGLLIIDEEQRFGVTHKEKIKKMKTSVDVISLSATPIPRTLHMSLVGIRDMSLLDEAPMERMPIQTFVFEQNDEMIREAVSRELARDGQVYYVTNRIQGIEDKAARISTLVPQARVAYAHGRMSKTLLEDIMADFINHEIDVLVATTIIEIGLDISNVNTIIIHDADMLGLSQLYQLRGRVGRSNRRAYAFLMYRRDKLLREVAEKRLAAIREFSELGSGFKIAMRDLEIRGAGTMLGEAQSGHMESVGYDLYCKLLSEAVKKEKGEVVEEEFETTVDLAVDAYIPAGYITDESQKLSAYRRISGIRSKEEKEELVEELVDRYGDPPKAVMNLLFVMEARERAHRVYVTEIKQEGKRVTFALLPDANLNPAGIPGLVKEYSPFLEFVNDKEKPAFSLDLTRKKEFSTKQV
ncbi:MAG: transcription-repair coupling factor, partial [Lachnospiraceae bacterium]|nr:transcription-repair coupling factor [Lachnospiraceae bacterium]